MKKIIAAFCLMASLAACSSQPAPPLPVSKVLPPKIALDVKTVSLADRSGIQPPNSPYKTNHFTPTIAEAVKQWASDRLQAGGQTGNAIVIVKDASLIAQPMAVKQDFFDELFTRPQGVKYIGHADVSIEANGKSGVAMASADATRVLTLPENPTDLEKQDAYYRMLTALMKDLGENLENGIRTHMGNFIVNGSTPVSAAPSASVSATPGAYAPADQKTGSSLDAPPLLSGTNVK